jgi:creatinine amidohydrolase
MKYEEMRPHEINAVLRDCPLAYLVWGAHEWHGVHNAVGLDTLKAYHMTLDLCRETGGVVLPPVYCGYQTMKPWMQFHHTFEFSKELVTQFVYEHLENLYDEGFKAIVVVMGHYGGKHVEAVKAGVAQFTEKHRYPKVLAMTDYEPAGWVNVRGGDHAGKNETSLLMHYRPDLVELGDLPEGELIHARDGCSVDAKEATAEHGAFLVKTFLEQATPKVRELLQQAIDEWPAEVSRGR